MLITLYRQDNGCVDETKATNDAATLREKFKEMEANSKQYLKCMYCNNYEHHIYDLKDCKDFCTIKHGNWQVSFHGILASRSWVQLKRTFEIYQKKYGSSFDEDIPKVLEYWSWYHKTLLSIYQYAMDSSTFFAMALKRDVHNFEGGTSWGYTYGVARVFTWRSEIDLGDIVKAFEKKYSQTLLEHVQYSISGDAKNALIGILQ